jgi:putative redox protein
VQNFPYRTDGRRVLVVRGARVQHTKEARQMARSVVVESIKGMRSDARVGPHRLILDAPPEAGGGDEGASPVEMLLGAIGAWTLSNVRRFAERAQWTLHRLEARLSATEAQGRITGVDVEFLVSGTLDESQLAKLKEAAEGCRISRALNVPLTSRLTLA